MGTIAFLREASQSSEMATQGALSRSHVSLSIHGDFVSRVERARKVCHDLGHDGAVLRQHLRRQDSKMFTYANAMWKVVRNSATPR